MQIPWDEDLDDLEKCHRAGLADRAGAMRLSLQGVATDLADVVINILIPAKIVERFLVQVGMNLFNRVGKRKAAQCGIEAFGLGFFDHLWVHAFKLVRFTADRFPQIGLGAIYPAGSAQMGVGVDRFSGSSSTEQLGDLLVPFCVSLFGKSQVFAVGLRLSGKGLH